MTTVLAMLYINTDKTDFKCLTIGAQLFQVGFPSMILASYIAEHGWLTSDTSLQSKRDKNNCSKYSFVETSSMNEDKITVVFLQAQRKFSKMRPKVQQILTPVCAAIAQR